MAKQEHDTLYVIAAAYDDVDAAVADYEAVKALYRAVQDARTTSTPPSSPRTRTGKVRIVKKHEQPTRHGAAVGLGWGLATGVAAALFPPVGIGIAAAGGAGAAIGGVAGHASRRDVAERPQGPRRDPRRRPGRPDRRLRVPTSPIRSPRRSRRPTASSPRRPTWPPISWQRT